MSGQSDTARISCAGHVAIIAPILGAALLVGTASAALALPAFSVTDWSGWEGTTAQTGTGGSEILTHIPGGPGTREGLRIRVAAGDSSLFYGIALNPRFTYDPRQGGFGSVTFSFYRDAAFWRAGAPCGGIALQQGGVTYVSVPVSCEMGASGMVFGATTVAAEGFDDISGAGEPDFSTAGAPITFGVYALETVPGRTSASTFYGLSLIANAPRASVLAVAMPEPASAALLLAGFGAMAGWRRRATRA